MARLLILGLAVFAIVWLLRRAMAEPQDSRRGARSGARSDGELVRCSHCGLHLPRGDALERDGKRFCSEEHARLGPIDDQ